MDVFDKETKHNNVLLNIPLEKPLETLNLYDLATPAKNVSTFWQYCHRQSYTDVLEVRHLSRR